MNIIEQWFNKNTIYLEEIDRIKIQSLSNFACIPCISRTNKRIYYRWFCKTSSIDTVLNSTQKKQNPICINKYCICCKKFLRNHRLSCIFRFRKYNTNTLLNYIPTFYRCKKCSNKLNALNSKDQRKLTIVNRYGVDNVLKLPQVIERIKNKKIAKFGINYAKIAAKKAKETYFNRTGYYHNGDNPIIRKRMTDKRKITVNNFSPTKHASIQKKRLEAYAKPGSKGMFGSNVEGVVSSQIADKFITKIVRILKLDSNEYSIERVIKTETRLYVVDLLIHNKLILEFYGDYWHANPIIYEKHDRLRVMDNITVEECWKRDTDRIQNIQDNLKLPVFIIWENTYRKQKDALLLEVLNKYNTLNYSEPKIYEF